MAQVLLQTDGSHEAAGLIGVARFVRGYVFLVLSFHPMRQFLSR